jgi:uncharacterized protein YjbJ (UPF0337 family)
MDESAVAGHMLLAAFFLLPSHYAATRAEKSAQKGRGRRILFMRSSTKDKIKGSLLEAKGKVKEESGKAVGNPDLTDRGTGEKVAGKVQKKIGDVKKVFGK